MELNLDQLEKEYIKNYNPNIFKRPNIAVDTLIFTIKDNALQVLIIKRDEFPYKEWWSFVGGFIDTDNDKDLEETAKRKLYEKTAVSTPYIEQLKTIGNPYRDPRGWTVSTIYFALIPSEDLTLQCGKGAIDIKWAKIINNQIEEKLAFDHAEILRDCLERLRSKVMYTSIPVFLLPNEFSLSQLQTIYEIILDKKIERKSFQRRMLNSSILFDTGRKKFSGRRPAKLYKLSNARDAHYFSRIIGS